MHGQTDVTIWHWEVGCREFCTLNMNGLSACCDFCQNFQPSLFCRSSLKSLPWVGLSVPFICSQARHKEKSGFPLQGRPQKQIKAASWNATWCSATQCEWAVGHGTELSPACAAQRQGSAAHQWATSMSRTFAMFLQSSSHEQLIRRWCIGDVTLFSPLCFHFDHTVLRREKVTPVGRTPLDHSTPTKRQEERYQVFLWHQCFCLQNVCFILR